MSPFTACLRIFRFIVTKITETVFPPRDTELLVRNTQFSSLLRFLSPKIIYIENVPIITLLPYHTPLVQAFIIEAKFHNNKKAQMFLGKVLENYFHTMKSSSLIMRLNLIPLPLGTRRKKERGYNQVEEILKSTGLTTNSNMLARVRETTPQTTLGREARIQNMTGAFCTISAPDPDISYVLVDDVVTTGATLMAGYAALIKAGAPDVILLALAH